MRERVRASLVSLRSSLESGPRMSRRTGRHLASLHGKTRSPLGASGTSNPLQKSGARMRLALTVLQIVLNIIDGVIGNP